MSAGTRNVRIFLSDEGFALLTEAIAQYSRNSARFQSMRATVQRACERTKPLRISREQVALFLADYPVGGEIPIYLEIKPDWAEDYDALRRKIAAITGKPPQDRLAVPFAVHLALTHDLY